METPTRRIRKKDPDTPYEYKKRCKDIPTCYDMVWDIPMKANFSGISRNNELVTEWIIDYFKRKKMTPVSSRIYIDNTYGLDIMFNYKTWVKFLKTSIFSKKLGVVPIVYKNNTIVHALLFFIDTRMKKKIDVYFIDSNGGSIKHNKDLEEIYDVSKRWILGEIKRNITTPFQMNDKVSSYILKTPILNDKKSSYMRHVDKIEEFDIIDKDEGFCQPWTYVILLDILCAPSQILKKDHYVRLLEESSGAYEYEEQQDYSRLIFMRTIMFWISKNMFNPRNKLYKKIIKNWKGELVFEDYSKIDTKHFYVYRGEHVAFV